MTSADSDRNLLFGILALQLDFISRDQLIEAMQAWVLEKARFLGLILRDRQFITEEQHQLLSALVAEHLRKHGGDPEASLASLSSLGSVLHELSCIDDAPLQKSLAVVSSQQTFSLREEDSVTSTGVGAFNLSGPRFRILRPHDEGGLGKVSVALDQELNREVALKEIKPKYAADDASRTRFVLEAEITGGLEHPGIVPVYGLGHYADGRPYYAMRFIRGDSLRKAIKDYHETDWSKRDPSERTMQLRRLLGRFLDVCHAVHYAHRRGVLHRDLKPGNIMLGEYGETLVVDWGLAKAVGKRDDPKASKLPVETALLPRTASGSEPTRQGAVIGSPPYMSPEQAQGDHDLLGPATDVYSLGATLYTVLTNAAPVEGDTGEDVLSKVRLGQWRRPRDVNREVPRALDAIGVKAMAMKPADRYPTARALAEDIERYLADESVSAHREPWPDRLSRLARRYRTLVRAAAAALALISLVSITAALAINHQRNMAVAARKESDKSMARAERVLEVLVNSLRRPDPSVDGRTVTVASVLDQAMDEIGNLTNDPEDQATLLEALANTYRGLGLHDKQLVASKKLFNLARGDEFDIAEAVVSMNHLAVAYLDVGKSDEALRLLVKAVDLARAKLGDDHAHTLTTMNNLATAFKVSGQMEQAIPLLEDALKHGRATLGDDHRDTLTWMNNLAMAYLQAGRINKALPLLEETRRVMHGSLGDDHPDTLRLVGNLALIYQHAGQIEKALPLLEMTLEHAQATFGPEHPDTLTAMGHLAGGYRAIGHVEKAIPILESELKQLRATLGEDHPNTLTSMNNLAIAYREMGHVENALSLLESLAKKNVKLGSKPPNRLSSKSNLAFAYLDAGQTDMALPILETVQQRFLTTLGQKHPLTVTSMHNLAAGYRAAGQIDKALPILESTLALQSAILGDDHPDTLRTSRDLACVLIASGQPDQGRLEDTLKRERTRLTDTDPRLGSILADVGKCLLEADQFEAAESRLREALEVFRKGKIDDWRRVHIQSMLGSALVGQEQYREAESLLVQGYKGMKQRKNNTPRPLPKHLQAGAQRLVDLYTAQGRLEEAAKWQVELESANARVEELRQFAKDVQSTVSTLEEPAEPPK